MNINGRWYSETELQAYIVTLEHKLATLEEKHLTECRQISEYDHELRQAKRLLKAAVEDFSKIYDHIFDCDGMCDICPLRGERDNCLIWRYANEALKLIGGEE